MLVALFSASTALSTGYGLSPGSCILPHIGGAGPEVFETDLLAGSRGAMIQALGSEFVRTARAAGLAKRTVLITYALRNALMPLITTLGMVFSFMLGANVLVEMDADGTFVAQYDLPGINQEGIAFEVDCPTSLSSVFISEDSGDVLRYDDYPSACVSVPAVPALPPTGFTVLGVLFAALAARETARIT